MSQTQVERLFIADKTIQFAKIFRLNTTFTTAGAYITANWEADDSPGVGQLGANIVTESSGVFSFTKTGLYKITALGSGSVNNDVRYAGVQIIGTRDNSTYGDGLSYNYSSTFSTNSENRFVDGTVVNMLDVTDTTNQKVKMYVDAEAAVNWNGGSTTNVTYIMFEYLGDT